MLAKVAMAVIVAKEITKMKVPLRKPFKIKHKKVIAYTGESGNGCNCC